MPKQVIGSFSLASKAAKQIELIRLLHFPDPDIVSIVEDLGVTHLTVRVNVKATVREEAITFKQLGGSLFVEYKGDHHALPSNAALTICLPFGWIDRIEFAS